MASSERVTLAANTGGYAAALSSREEVREVKARQTESDTARTFEPSAFEFLHGCLKTGIPYNEHTAWAHHNQDQQIAA